MIAFNPAQRVEKPKKVRYTGAKHFNEMQIELLLERSKGDPLEIVILLALFYGLRRSEVAGLKWGAIDIDNDTITIKHTIVEFGSSVHMSDSTKNDASYATIPLPGEIRTVLERWKETQLENRLLQPNDYYDSDYVCTQLDGSLIKPNYVSQHFKILLKNCGLSPIRFHDLRHSSAGYLKYLGFDLKDIQHWLRHKDIQTTLNIYVNLDMDDNRNIANTLNERLSNFI
jgi:integrase